MRVLLAGFLAGALMAAAQAPSSTLKEQLAQANVALQAGEADKALALLKTLPRQGAGAAEAHGLACRVYYTLDGWDAAANECEQAISLDGHSSEYHLWMGRALGEKADRASFLTAFSLGKRVRIELEKAAQLNPRNAEALSDLGNFYFVAPSIMGGGAGKAESVAQQLDKIDPVRAHYLRGRMAEERKDYSMAEREYKQSLAVSPHPAFQWSSLAAFYQRRERWVEMETAEHNVYTSAEHDKHAGVALYDGASVLRLANRDFALAAKMLEIYLAGSSKTEEAPAFKAHLRLASLKEQLGDKDAAQRERAAAQALAHDYKPSQEAKH